MISLKSFYDLSWFTMKPRKATFSVAYGKIWDINLQVNEAARLADSVLKKESPSSSFPEAPCAMSTWPNLQDTLQFEKAAASIVKSQRPHTISSGYFLLAFS